jgi:hypothetical protein
MRRVVLSLPGGGAMGLIQIACLAEVERRLGFPLTKNLALIVGTSVGSINGGVLASGRKTAQQTEGIFEHALRSVFQRTGFMPKYDRRNLQPPIDGALGAGFLMRDCVTKFLATSVGEVSGRTHYFKSWEQTDGALPLLAVMQRSSAAPMFFGGMVDEAAQEVWLDGGTGMENCPLFAVVTECLRQGWMTGADTVHVLNIGTGWRPFGTPFARARRRWMKNLREVLGFMDPADGGMARHQSTVLAIAQCEALAATYPWFTFQAVDCDVTPDQDQMDALDHAEEYRALGTAMAQKVNLGVFA